MIFDRTKQDVQNAVKIREEKIKKFETLTAEEGAILDRGMLTLTTLNRIETKQEELKNLFNEMGYWNTPIENKQWTTNQLFNEAEFNRLIGNVNVLRGAFFVFKNTPPTPPVSYYYEDINALEKILFDLGEMVDDVKSHYRECGDFECGEG